MFEAGLRDVRNQGVLLNGVNADPHALLDLCFGLLDGARIMPYYFYMCDMIPFSEHWRVSVADAQRLQHHIMGYLPGFATPRIVCDVPFVGKRWVHQLADYDTERGISYWTKNYRTSIEAADPDALDADLRVLRPDPHAARGRPALVGRALRPVLHRPEGRRGRRGLPPYRRPPGLVRRGGAAGSPAGRGTRGCQGLHRLTTAEEPDNPHPAVIHRSANRRIRAAGRIWARVSSMDLHLPPIVDQRGVFLRCEAIALGYDDRAIRSSRPHHDWVRVRRGAYMRAECGRRLDEPVGGAPCAGRPCAPPDPRPAVAHDGRRRARRRRVGACPTSVHLTRTDGGRPARRRAIRQHRGRDRRPGRDAHATGSG